MASIKVRALLIVVIFVFWFIMSETLLAPVTDAIYYAVTNMSNLTYEYSVRNCERSVGNANECLQRAEMWRGYISMLTSVAFSSVLTVMSLIMGLNRVLGSERGREQELF
jgi:hypothetical protein